MQHTNVAVPWRGLLQVAGTLLLLAFVPGNGLKTALLLAFWAVTFGRLRGFEVALVVCACVVFSVMDVMSLRQGIFRFEAPDWLGLPAYEFFLWGFYVLNLVRTLGGPVPANRWPLPLAITIVFAATFAAVVGDTLLLAASGFVVAVALALWHDRSDLAYLGYMVGLGALVEFVGVHAGLWSYPQLGPGGIPAWFVTLWGGVGLLVRRLVLPLLARDRCLPGLLADASRPQPEPHG